MAAVKRVLVVDNDPDVLDAVKYNLEMAGYQVLAASSAEEAHELIARQIIHVAIVDIRLKDEKRPEDASGFDVVQELPDHIPCIISSAYVDGGNITRAPGRVKAKDILYKKSPAAASQLIDLVDELFNSEVKTNFDLEIQGELNPDNLAARIGAPVSDETPGASAEDVRQILQSLFREAHAVEIGLLPSREPCLASARIGSALIRARPHMPNGLGAPVIVKLGFRDNIMREADNYERIVPYLGGQRLADLRSTAYSRQVGGLVYSLLDVESWDTIHMLADVFFAESTATTIELLKDFFEQTFGALYTGARMADIDLTATYTAELGLTPSKLCKALEEFHPEALTEQDVHFEDLGRFRNPIMWALDGSGFRGFRVRSRQCLCHGDLHSRNVLVDARRHCWLVDFERVAESHAVRDLAELETDIKFNLLPGVRLPLVHVLEQALLAASCFQDSIPKQSFDEPELDRVYQVILALRRFVADLIGLEGDMREYYQALFIHTLNVMRLRQIKPASKEYALLSAALLRERLEHWPGQEVFPQRR